MSEMHAMNLPLFFLTDFGHKDPYVGIMKAVALSIGYGGMMIDLTHGIPPQDVLAGAVALEDSLPYLPEDCVVCAVVDPGVGTDRRPIAVRAGGRYFVGPDNGIFTPIYTLGDYQLRVISAGGPVVPQRSSTFHGRDVFAPAGTLLATGKKKWEEIGPVDYFPKRLDLPPVRINTDGSIELRIISVDHFGNIMTNLRRAQVPENVDLKVGRFVLGDRELGRLRNTFEDVHTGNPIVYFNSSNRLTIGVSMGNAAKFFGIGRGTTVTFIPGPGA